MTENPLTTKDNINLFHIIIVAPLLLWLGVTHGRGVPETVWNIVIFMAIIVFFYHSYRLINRFLEKEEKKDMDYH